MIPTPESPRTSPALERGVALLFGVEVPTARLAVDALVAHGRLADGIALQAELLAARKGTDASGAIVLLATGELPATEWSAYEERFAAEEVADDIRLPPIPTTADTVRVGGADAPSATITALRRGARTIAVDRDLDPTAGLAPERARCDLDFVTRLVTIVGGRILTVTNSGDPAAGRQLLDETVERSPSYLDVLSAL